MNRGSIVVTALPIKLRLLRISAASVPVLSGCYSRTVAIFYTKRILRHVGVRTREVMTDHLQ